MPGSADKYRVLVTGASGLIGQHVIKRLGMVDNFSVVAQTRREITIHGMEAVAVMQLEWDATGAENLLVNQRPDVIVHCAAQIPTVTISAGAAAAINREIDTVVCSVADRCGAQIVFISSVSVYQNNSCPWKENAEIHPTNPYARQKQKTETRIAALNQHNTSLRISSPYGGKQGANRNVLYKFIHAAIQGKTLEIYGAGVRQQDFIYAADIAEAVYAVIAANLAGRTAGGIYNIASGSPISMKELAELIIHTVGRGKIIHTAAIDTQEGFTPRIDIHKARDILNWKPRTSLALGIKQTIASIKEE